MSGAVFSIGILLLVEIPTLRKTLKIRPPNCGMWVNSSAFITTPPIEASPGGTPALQAPPGLQPLPDDAPDLLALGGYRQLEEPARHPGPQGGHSGRARVLLALGNPFGEVLLAGRPVLYHHVMEVVEHLSRSPLLSSVRPGRADAVRVGIGVGDLRSRRAKLEAPGPLGPEASPEKCNRARSSSSHRDLVDLGTHLSREHRYPYVRDKDVHQSFGPLRDNNIASTLPSRRELVNVLAASQRSAFSLRLFVSAACLIDVNET